MARREALTDAQWVLLEPLIPETARHEDGKGRPEMHSNRAVMNGILWVLRTGAAWADLPERFPSGSTCYSHFSRWVKAGVFRQILETLARDLEERGQIDLSQCLIDGAFVVAKSKGRKKPATQDGRVLRRYKRRWKVERFFAWLNRFKRVTPVGIIALTVTRHLFTWLALVNFAFTLLYGFSIFDFSLHNISPAHAFTLLFAVILSSSYFLIGWALLSRGPMLLKWARRCNYFLLAFGVLEIIPFIAISILSALLVSVFIFLPLLYNLKTLKQASVLVAL